ncbi:MAG: hypothetical protein WCK41_05110 [Actinomycetes bacterium]
MATIRASCGECGDVELDSSDLNVLVCLHGNKSTYSFRCPVCTVTVIKPAAAITVDLLVASGVPYETWSPPGFETAPRLATPITKGEVRDFREFLDDDTRVFDALAGLAAG